MSKHAWVQWVLWSLLVDTLNNTDTNPFFTICLLHHLHYTFHLHELFLSSCETMPFAFIEGSLPIFFSPWRELPSLIVSIMLPWSFVQGTSQRISKVFLLCYPSSLWAVSLVIYLCERSTDREQQQNYRKIKCRTGTAAKTLKKFGNFKIYILFNQGKKNDLCILNDAGTMTVGLYGK